MESLVWMQLITGVEAMVLVARCVHFIPSMTIQTTKPVASDDSVRRIEQIIPNEPIARTG